MPTALIQINGVTGSNLDLPIGTVVNLSNASNTGVTTWLWTILDQPAGTPDTLSSSTASAPTFTPHKEGTYLLKLNVNGSMSGIENQTTAAVLQVKTRTRVPAAGETVESSSTEGWHGTALEQSLQLLDAMRADPGIVVAQTGAGGLVPGDVVAFTSDAVIKSGLPGQETVPVVTLALANVLADVNWDLGVIITGVNGSSSPGSGALVFVRRAGLFLNVNQTSPTLGGTVYVSDTGVMSATAGTNSRAVGRCVNVIDSTHFDVWLSGEVGSGAGGGGTLVGDVIGPIGSNTLNTTIATAVTWSSLQTFDAGIATDTIETALTTTLALSAHTFDFIGAVSNWQPTAGATAPKFNFQAYNTTPALVDAAGITGKLSTATAGAEESEILFFTRTGGGTELQVAQIAQGLSLGTVSDNGLGYLTLPFAGGVSFHNSFFYNAITYNNVSSTPTIEVGDFRLDTSIVGAHVTIGNSVGAPHTTGLTVDAGGTASVSDLGLTVAAAAASIVGLNFEAYNTTPALVHSGSIHGILTTTTPGAESSAIEFWTGVGGAGDAEVMRLGKSLMLGHTLDYTNPAISFPAQPGFTIAVNDAGTLFPALQSTNAYMFYGGTGYTTVIESAGELEIYATTDVLLAGPGGNALTAYSSGGVFIGTGTRTDPGANNLTVQGVSKLHGLILVPTVPAAGAYAVLATDSLIKLPTQSAGITVTFPSGSTQTCIIEANSDGATNHITIAITGGTVNGSPTITTAYGRRIVTCDGTNAISQ